MFARTFLSFCLALAPVTAAAKMPRIGEIVQAQMRSGWQAETGQHMAGVKLTLAPDWMTYWRHPGESGIVPKLDWSGSRNVAQARIVWPEPRLYFKAGFASVGYTGAIMLPIEVTPERPGEPVELQAMFNIGVCSDVCVPVDLPLSLHISGPGAYDREIATALDQRPQSARNAGMQAVECTLTPDRRAVRLTAALTMPSTGAHEFVVVEVPGQPTRALPSRREGDVLSGHSLIRQDGTRSIDRSQVRLSVISERGTLVHQGCAMSD